jgi:hypothetical protein
MLSLFLGMIEERVLPFDSSRISWLAIACYTAVLLSLWLACAVAGVVYAVVRCIE